MKIVSVIGARPQFIKAATVSRVLRAMPGIQDVIIHTGQHYDSKMSEIFFQELDIPEPDYNLEVGSGSHAYQTARMLEGIESILIREKPNWVLVYGDTNSTVSGALAAAKLHIPVAHVEAGLRSFNKIMPEEINRIVTDHISDLLFAPTQTAITNLEKEGRAQFTHFTGDVMYDSVLYYKHWIEQSQNEKETTPSKEPYFLATIHRAENTDDPSKLEEIFAALSYVDAKFIVPLHPRTRKILDDKIKIGTNIQIIEPVGYLEMLQLTLGATKVITDSGGLQKEAYFLQKPCITIRTETEWIETIHGGWNIITGTNSQKIIQAIKAPSPTQPQTNQFGDGNAAQHIIDIIVKNS